MQFSDTTNKLGIIEDITFLTGQDTNSFPLADRVRLANERYRLINKIIFESYGGWQFIDDNVSDTSTGVPYADQTITSGTGLYALPTGAQTVQGVEIKNSGGTYEVLEPITHKQFMELGGDASFTSNSVPRYYMLQGDVLRLLPVPNYTQAASVRVFFDQSVSVFAASDTTKTPGFDSDFHRMISIGVALDYAVSHAGQADKAANYANLWADYESRLRKFYSKRFQDRFPHRISVGDSLREFS